MASPTRTTVWTTLQTLTSSALNAEFNNLLNNLQLVNADISAGAAIATSKIAFGGASGQYVKSDGVGGISYAALVINRAFTFYLDGTSIVADELGAKYIVPEDMTVVAIRYKTVSGTATLRVQKDTTDILSGIAATSSSGVTTTITSAALTAGQVLTLDVTAASAPVGITVTIECTQ